MYFKKSHLLVLGTVCAALLTACGGGSGGASIGAGESTAQVVPASGIVAYFNSLFANSNDDATPVDVSLVTLSEDDSAEPAALP